MSVTRPADIERESMTIIGRELAKRGIALSPDTAAVVRRVIHATADFDFARTLRFTPGAAERGVAALRGGAAVVTDTNMARAGVSQRTLERLGGAVYCYMADPAVAAEAKRRDCTRAAVAAELALRAHPGAVLAVGNAPTALLRLTELLDEGARPALVIAVPVGFVNVSESKERVFDACERLDVPCVAAMGRKGGSPVAAAICNALLYEAAGLEQPERRM